MLRKLYWFLRYGTMNEDKVQCKKEGHKWETVGRTEVQVPEGQSHLFNDLPEDEFIVTEGSSLPDGQSIWAPIESSNQKCSRCDEYRHNRSL